MEGKMRRRFSVGSLVLAVTVGLGLVALVGSVGATPPLLTMGTATNPTYTTVDVTGTVDTSASTEQSEEEGEWWFEVSSDGGANWERGNVAGPFGQPVEGTIEGLKAGQTYKVRLAAYNYQDFQAVQSANSEEFTTESLPAQTVTIEPVTGQSATAAHFVGHIDPEAPAGNPSASTVHFHFHCEPIACPSAENEQEVAPGSTPVEVDADATDLEPNKTYEVTLVTRDDGGNEVSAGPVSFLTDESAPLVRSLPAFVLEGGTRALLGGKLNSLNSHTTYWFEYGPTAAYGQSTPHLDGGSANALQTVRQQIAGLEPGQTYHFRLVAESDAGAKAESEDTPFTTSSPVGDEACPNAAARAQFSTHLPDCRAYEMVTPPDLAAATRTPVFPWPITHPWNLVSADGSSVLWDMFQKGSPGVDLTGFNNLYVSRRGTAGWTSNFASPPGSKSLGSAGELVWASSDLERMLFFTWDAFIDPTDIDPLDPTQPHDRAQYRDLYRRDPDGTFTRMSKGSLALPVNSEAVVPYDISSDGSNLLFLDNRQLEPDAAPSGADTVYERHGDSTVVVNKDNQGNLLPGSTGLAVSDDGNRVVFSQFGAYLYLRDVATLETTLIAEDVSGNLLNFAALSTDGQRVVFSATVRISADDEDNSRDVYVYNTQTGAYKRISAPTGSPDGPGPGNSDSCAAPIDTCEAESVAISRDASQIYFTSAEQLDGNKGVAGERNLYLSDAAGVHFVATVNPEEARFTPDESKLIFTSRAALTGYDNTGHAEIYVYDPTTGQVLCASCRPSGAPPTADAGLGNHALNSDNFGHIFFGSRDPILTRDTNGRSDVYEYDLATGATALISTGISPNDSNYIGNGVDGKDVYFFTPDALASNDDVGRIYKVYDARVDGADFGPPLQPPECTGEGCRGPVAPEPEIVSPATTRPRHPPRTLRRSRLSVSGPRSVTGTKARLSAKVSGAGRLRVFGPGIAATSIATSRAGAYPVTVRLNRASKARLGRRHRLALSATFRFVPREGASRSLRIPVTFKTASTKKGH